MTQAFEQQPSISDLVLQPQVLASPVTAEFSPPAVQNTTSPTAAGGVLQQNPRTSLLLDNITYDAILASSAKGLRLTPGSASPLPSSDARAPPNTPSSAEMSRYGSFSSMAGTK